MIEFNKSDFVPLEQFAYTRRWTDKNHTLLSEQELALIRPLTSTKASELWTYTDVYWSELDRYLYKYKGGQLQEEPSITFFAESIHVIPALSTTLYQKIERELWILDPREDLMVLVLWDKIEAVVTTWKLFCTYWDSFCYPIMDDVGIFPVSEEWFLNYHHSQYLLWGRLFDPKREQELREALAERERLVPSKPLISKDEVARLLKTGEPKDKITAIKLYRDETGVKLNKAKEAVEKIEEEMKHKQEDGQA